MARIGYACYLTLRDAIDNLKPGDTLTIMNLTLKSDSYGQRFRGLNIARSSSSSIVLDNVDIYLPYYYTLNLTSNNHDLLIELTN